MNKATLIVTIAFGIGIFFTSSTQAINTVHLSEMIMKANTEMGLEKEIELHEWMLTPESFRESAGASSELELNVRNWMLEPSWISGGKRMVSESGIVLENWMLEPFGQENREIALEDWMLRSFKPEKPVFVSWDWAI